MFPSFLYFRLEGAARKFVYAILLFLIFISWYDVFLLESRKYTWRKGESEASKYSWNRNYRGSFFVQSHFNVRLMHDERVGGRERELFMYTKQHFNSRKLNFVHYIFMLLRFLLPCITNFSPKLQQVALNVHFHTFISFPSPAELLRCAMKNMKMFRVVFSSFFFLQVFMPK